MMRKVLIFVVTLSSMWYFVEKNGRVVAKKKTVYAIWCKWAELVKAGENPHTIDVVDQYGHAV